MEYDLPEMINKSLINKINEDTSQMLKDVSSKLMHLRLEPKHFEVSNLTPVIRPQGINSFL